MSKTLFYMFMPGHRSRGYAFMHTLEIRKDEQTWNYGVCQKIRREIETLEREAQEKGS